MALFIFLLTAMIVMEKYIGRGLAGRWKTMGDTFGQGRHYDPRPFGLSGEGNGTLECYFDYTHCNPGGPPCVKINAWINRACFDKKCRCWLPEDAPEYDNDCLKCIKDCRTSMCN